MKNLISGTNLEHSDLKLRSLFKLPPWNIPSVNYLCPFDGFQKCRTSVIVFQQLLQAHRALFNNYLDIYTAGSKDVDTVYCGCM